ncbi:hypothetical protein P0F65_06595 [Sphingomonas sp. I4]
MRASVSFVLGAGFENLTLTGTAAIDATGNDAANVIIGNAGRNTLSGGAGDDTIVTVTGTAAIRAGGGFDRVDGGSGSDTLLLGGLQSDYQLLSSGNRTLLVTARGATDVTGVEQVGFFNTPAQSFATLQAGTAAFDGLSYIASYSDLRAAFGTDAAKGFPTSWTGVSTKTARRRSTHSTISPRIAIFAPLSVPMRPRVPSTSSTGGDGRSCDDVQRLGVSGVLQRSYPDLRGQ